MWIYEQPNWPNFTWDANIIAPKLADTRHHQGHLLGGVQQLGFRLRCEATLNTLTSDVVNSAAIEGENLNMQEVRSSIAGRLGLDVAGLTKPSRNVESIVEMMLDATQQFPQALTRERLFGWHATLFPTGYSGMNKITVGGWRAAESGSMQVISGPIGKEKIHFEAPHANHLEQEMQAFLKWFNDGNHTDPVIKAGVAHLWFVTIHPFEDGNGRIGRAISDMALARADGTKERFYSLSSQIESERKYYYQQLEKQQRATIEITEWLSWFLDCLKRAIAEAKISLKNIMFKAQLWDDINQKPVNERQCLVINRMLEDDFKGFMNTSKYAKLAKCSKDSALRDIKILKDRGIFIQNPSGGRSTSYRLKKEAPRQEQ